MWRPRNPSSPGTTRLLRPDDAPALLRALIDNRRFLQPWEPTREDGFFTLSTQQDLVQRALRAHADGTVLPLVILDEGGDLAGRLTLSGITRGAFQSTAMAYWVRADRNGRGLATAAVAEAMQRAFSELSLHRVQAETLLHNTASQRILDANGFRPFGVAPKYLKIAGRWQDHVLYQRLSDEEGA